MIVDKIRNKSNGNSIEEIERMNIFKTNSQTQQKKTRKNGKSQNLNTLKLCAKELKKKKPTNFRIMNS